MCSITNTSFNLTDHSYNSQTRGNSGDHTYNNVPSSQDSNAESVSQ